MNPVRVLVVDDHTLFREGLAALLDAAPETTIAGQAATGNHISNIFNKLQVTDRTQAIAKARDANLPHP